MCIISATTAKRLIGHHRFEFAHKGKQFFFNATISCSLFYHFSSVRRLSATYALKAHPLRFAQVLKNQLYLPSGQSARGTLVAHALQGREQTVGRGDVLVQQAQGRGTRGTGEVELGELALGEGLYHGFSV